MSIFNFFSGLFSSSSLEKYSDTTPIFNLEDYFCGNIKAWGIIQDRKGNVIKRFDVDMVGTWQNDVGTLDEKFKYYDGTKQNRIWEIKKVYNKYQGRAYDIIGHASGESKGCAVRWNYIMELPVGNAIYRIKFDDWMFMMNDNVLINRSYLKKMGVKVAELTLFMQKQDCQ